MKLSKKAEDELSVLGKSDSLKQDMIMMKAHWHDPFIKDDVVDIDAYIKFVQQFNEFINHEPKPFKPMIDKEMRL